MGKTDGFLQFNRAMPKKRPVAERLCDHNEYVGSYDAEELSRQSARCMNCGVPFCHNGCPLGNLIPDFNDAVYNGDFKLAYELLIRTNNFPEFTGRLCPAPCESACVLGINKPAVAIEEIEKHIIEIAFEKKYVTPRIPTLRTGKKVAVIGSGPAGLAAAAQLNTAGHSVTVFEKNTRPGGLLRYGIPDFKLEKKVIDRRIILMKEEGVHFRCNSHIGVNVNINDLLRNYHAIILATGSEKPRDLPIKGRELRGVYFAMDFLKQQNKINSGTAEFDPLLNVKDKHVVVIGGGDTGSDCIGTANRQGARSITQLELLPKPPETRNENMPWPKYPMLFKITSSHEEGAERLFAVATKEFLGDESGALKAIKLVDVVWNKDETGTNNGFIELPDSERTIPCEFAFLAMGFVHPVHEGLLKQLEIETDERGNIKSDENYRTNISKVFTAGDAHRGQSLIVWAISEGRECARKTDQFLSGSSALPSKDEALFRI